MYQKTAKGLHLENAPKIDYCNYWGIGKSTFEEQKFNVNGMTGMNGKTKVDSILQYAKGDSLLEIACSPAELLRVAKHKRKVGIAPEIEYLEQMKRESGAEIIGGYFEDYDSNEKFDTIVAMDLLEHLEDGQGFIDRCKKHLKKDGRIILMLPLIMNDGLFDDKHLHPEHIWIYSQDYIEEWLKPTLFDRWIIGHEIIVLDKI